MTGVWRAIKSEEQHDHISEARCGAPGVTNGFARMNTFRIARYSEQPHEALMISMLTDSFASGDFWNAPSEF